MRRNTWTPWTRALPPFAENAQSLDPPSRIGAIGAVNSARTCANSIERQSLRYVTSLGDVEAVAATASNKAKRHAAGPATTRKRALCTATGRLYWRGGRSTRGDL